MKEDGDITSWLDSFGKARDKARRTRYKCLCPNCSRNAINSHLVQQHPFLESIAEDGFLYQIKDNEVDPRSGDFSDSKELKLSIRQVLSFPLFCSEHDNGLFKSIENDNVDFNSPQTFLLFSLRGLAGQRYLEEKRLVLYQNTGFTGFMFNDQRDYSKHIIDRFDCTLEMMYNDVMKQNYSEYIFSAIKFPFLPICGSDAVVDEDEMTESFCNGNKKVRPLNTLFMTLLPFANKNELMLITGYHQKYVSKRQKQFYQHIQKHKDAKTVFQVIYRMKSWCCSPSLIEGTDFATQYEINRIKIIMEQGGC